MAEGPIRLVITAPGPSPGEIARRMGEQARLREQKRTAHRNTALMQSLVPPVE